MQDTKSTLTRNEVLGEHLIFFCAFSGRGILKLPPHLGIYEMVRYTRGKSFKRHPSYRSTYISGIKKHGFRHEIAHFRYKKSICDDLQLYTDMM